MTSLFQDLHLMRQNYVHSYVTTWVNLHEGNVTNDQLETWENDAFKKWNETYPAARDLLDHDELMGSSRPMLTTPTQYVVCYLPETHQDFPAYVVTVAKRSQSLWAVLDAFGRCFDKYGLPSDEPSPSNRTTEWLQHHRFTLVDALELAHTVAPRITVNDLTAAERLEMTQDDT